MLFCLLRGKSICRDAQPLEHSPPSLPGTAAPSLGGKQAGRDLGGGRSQDTALQIGRLPRPRSNLRSGPNGFSDG